MKLLHCEFFLQILNQYYFFYTSLFLYYYSLCMLIVFMLYLFCFGINAILFLLCLIHLTYDLKFASGAELHKITHYVLLLLAIDAGKLLTCMHLNFFLISSVVSKDLVKLNNTTFNFLDLSLL